MLHCNCVCSQDNEKRRVLEAKQAKAEKDKINQKKRKDGVRTTLNFQEDECIVDKLLTEIRQGFPLKKRRRTSTDDNKDAKESASTKTSDEGINPNKIKIMINTLYHI